MSDRCTDSGAVAVDADGCSHSEFCGATDATAPEGRRRCRRSDWQNDEPIMRRLRRDCQIEKNGNGPEDDRCVPRPQG